MMGLREGESDGMAKKRSRNDRAVTLAPALFARGKLVNSCIVEIETTFAEWKKADPRKLAFIGANDNDQVTLLCNRDGMVFAYRVAEVVKTEKRSRQVDSYLVEK